VEGNVKRYYLGLKLLGNDMVFSGRIIEHSFLICGK